MDTKPLTLFMPLDFHKEMILFARASASDAAGDWVRVADSHWVPGKKTFGKLTSP